MTRVKAKSQESHLIQFLNKFNPGEFLALTAIKPDGPAITKSFDKNKLKETREFIEDKNNNGYNIYFSVNPVSRKINKKASKSDIKELAYLHVDIDPDINKDIKEERKRILGLIENSPLKPTIIIDSGSGYQAFWELENPIIVNGNIEELEFQNKRIQQYFNADHCSNIDRIMRMPGTKNFPNKKKKKAGRGISESKLLCFNENKYSLHDFSVFDPLEHIKNQESEIEETEINEEEVWEKFESLCAKDMEVKKRWEGDSFSLKDTSRSGFDMSMVSLLKKGGFSYSETKFILLDYPFGKGMEMTDQYFRHTWKKAGGIQKDKSISISDILSDSGMEQIKEETSPEEKLAAFKRAVELSRGLPDIDVGFLKDELKKKLREANVSAPTEMVKKAFPIIKQDENENQGLFLKNPTPFESEVNGEELLNNFRELFNRYLGLPKYADVSLALWVMFAWCHDAFVISPLLNICSPTKRCGKSTTLEILNQLLPRSLSVANTTSAALFRSIEAYKPTLLIDEVDTFLNMNEEIQGILNAGHKKSEAYVLRVVGDQHEPKRFCVWGPKVISGIGGRKDTLEDRSISISMRRKSKEEKVQRFRLSKKNNFGVLCQKAHRWAIDNIESLKESNPRLPESLNDRAQDNWEPLISIADLCGGEWPELARKAAIEISGKAELESESFGEILLGDIRFFFEQEDKKLWLDSKNSGLLGVVDEKELDKQVPSYLLADYLGDLETRPWPEYKNGKPITPRQIATILKGFEIEPKNIRFKNKVLRGYYYIDFADAFDRYLSATSATRLKRKQLSKNIPATNLSNVAENFSIFS